MSIGDKLKSFGIRKYGSLKELAAELEMSPSNLSQYTQDKSAPGAQMLRRLQKLGCDINWLLEETTEHVSIEEAEQNHVTVPDAFKIVGMVPAGLHEVNEYEWFESEDLSYDPTEHAFLKIDHEFGYSMMPLVKPGDLVLISFREAVRDGDLVAARWDETKGALKIYSESEDAPDMVVLTSYNQAIPPIFVHRSKVKLYKVVNIKKVG